MSRYVKLNRPNPESHQRAKELRQKSPLVEQIMWYKLRLAAKGKDFRFRRQYPIDPYIADFACLKYKLIIEIDGMSHDARLEYDERRNEYMKGLGYEILRFTNGDILENGDGVIQVILNRISELTSDP